MKKELILGIGAIATVGAIGGGVLMLSGDKNDRGLSNEDKTTVSDEDRKKIEDLTWEEWGDKTKFSFCYGNSIIETERVDPLLNGSGSVDHESKELLLLDKTKQRMYILARNINYSYEGVVETPWGDPPTSVLVKEHGSIDETYDRNTMPIRIDFGGNYIATDPDTKKTNWVYSTIGEETEMVKPAPGCEGVHKLDGSVGKDTLSGNEVISIKRPCNISDVLGTYTGQFVFVCSLIDAKHARDFYDEKRELEALTKEDVNSDLFNSGTDDIGANRASDGSLRNTDTNESPTEQTPANIQKALNDMKNEMNASQREP
jgi:hypothetical protein